MSKMQEPKLEQAEEETKIPDPLTGRRLCRLCGARPVPPCWVKNWYYLCGSCHRNRYNKKFHEIVIQGYGGKCSYCGSKENLQIDHILGDGRLHPIPDHQIAKIWRQLIAKNFPKGYYQVLCRKCNIIKGNRSEARLLKIIRRRGKKLEALLAELKQFYKNVKSCLEARPTDIKIPVRGNAVENPLTGIDC